MKRKDTKGTKLKMMKKENMRKKKRTKYMESRHDNNNKRQPKK